MTQIVTTTHIPTLFYKYPVDFSGYIQGLSHYSIRVMKFNFAYEITAIDASPPMVPKERTSSINKVPGDPERPLSIVLCRTTQPETCTKTS